MTNYWIAYGKKGGKIHIVPVLVADEDNICMTSCGLSYHTHVLKEDEIIHGLSANDLRKHTSNCCLLLPYKEKSESEF